MTDGPVLRVEDEFLSGGIVIQGEARAGYALLRALGCLGERFVRPTGSRFAGHEVADRCVTISPYRPRGGSSAGTMGSVPACQIEANRREVRRLPVYLRVVFSACPGRPAA